MKYLLINQQTEEETLCDKVTIDGFEYYVCDDVCYPNNAVYSSVTNTIVRFTDPRHFSEGTYKKVIATNNPNIDVPKVVDEVERLFWKILNSETPQSRDELLLESTKHGFKFGYNKSQETHSNSDEDMIEFNEWCETSVEANLFWRRNRIDPKMDGSHNRIRKQKMKELLQLWKEQKPKIVYYV